MGAPIYEPLTALGLRKTDEASPGFLDTLLREAKAAGGAVTGLPSALYHAAADPESPEEAADYGKGFESKIGPTGRVLDRMVAQPIQHAVSDYAHGRINLDNALSVAPEALGGAGGGVAFGHAVSTALAGEHPQIASEALREHSQTGGSTYEPTTGRNLAGSRGVTVGVAPEHTALSDTPFTPEQYSEFVRTHRDVLTRHPNMAVGTDVDPSGLHRMELVAKTPSRAAAQRLAAHLGEDHIYDLETDERVPVEAGRASGRPVPGMSVDERMAQLNEDAPQKSPYSGIHYSDQAFDTINGARRGGSHSILMPSAEAPRLRLGSQTGMGEDAPPGFYTYKAGSLPDAVVAGRKNMYQVRGQMAFASTETPEFQNGYRDGVNRAVEAGADAKTAHQLGLNAAEHAVRNAGYDGYYSPTHPNIRFHFGSTPAVPLAPKLSPNLGKWQAPPELGSFSDAPDIGAKVRNANPEPTRAEVKAGRAKIVTPNGSGESAASQEALNRQAADKLHGITYHRVDTRSGVESPLIGPDAIDVKPGPFDVIVKRSPQGDMELARGAHAH